MDNPEKLATQGIQDKDKQNKNITQYMLDTTIRKQTQIILSTHTQTTGSKDEPRCYEIEKTAIYPWARINKEKFAQ